MKISIYKLLGMVKDGNAPKRILYDNYIWSWTGDDYRTILKDEKEQFLITGMYYTWLTEFLNDTVEILEEPKGIPEKMMMCTSGIMSYEAVEHITTELKDKINEIIDTLEMLNDKIK